MIALRFLLLSLSLVVCSSLFAQGNILFFSTGQLGTKGGLPQKTFFIEDSITAVLALRSDEIKMVEGQAYWNCRLGDAMISNIPLRRLEKQQLKSLKKLKKQLKPFGRKDNIYAFSLMELLQVELSFEHSFIQALDDKITNRDLGPTNLVIKAFDRQGELALKSRGGDGLLAKLLKDYREYKALEKSYEEWRVKREALKQQIGADKLLSCARMKERYEALQKQLPRAENSFYLAKEELKYFFEKGNKGIEEVLQDQLNYIWALTKLHWTKQLSKKEYMEKRVSCHKTMEAYTKGKQLLTELKRLENQMEDSMQRLQANQSEWEGLKLNYLPIQEKWIALEQCNKELAFLKKRLEVMKIQ